MWVPLSQINQEKQLVHATSPYTTIGTFYTYERISSNCKVIVEYDQIAMLQRAGRTIHSEYVNSPLSSEEIIPMGGNNEINGGGHQVLQYYYNATPDDGIILSEYELDNSIDSLLIVLEQLAQDAQFLLPNNTTKQINNKILGYNRSINSDYTSNTYNVVCGSYNSTFINDIDTFVPSTGMKISDYFASFIPQNHFNSSLHTISSTYFSLLDVDLYDDLESKSIDLIHMFASIDGIALDSSASTGAPPYSIMANPNFFRNAVSWGGDLQQACDYVRSAYTSLTSFTDVLNGSYCFGWEDFLADVDAINIATGFSLANSNSILITDRVIEYYGSLTLSSRYSNFKNNLIELYDGSGTNEEKFVKTVKHLVAISESNTSEYESANIIVQMKWKYLIVTQSTLPTVGCRVSIANLFIGYINSKV